MPLLRLLRPLSLLVALMGASTVAWAQAQPPAPAQPQPSQRRAPVDRQSHPNRDQQGLADSVRRAERNGQVLSAEQVQYDGRDVNRVKIVDDKGRVRVYWDDPAAKPQSPSNPQQRRANKPPKGGRTHDDDDGDPTL